MIPALIGLAAGILIILIFLVLKQINKPIVFGMILTGIGFLYVGFVWSDTSALIQACIQAIIFLFIGYFGAMRSIPLLAAGYFLHGAWDFVYPYIGESDLVPPGYEYFCSILDFTIGLYILLVRKSFSPQRT